MHYKKLPGMHIKIADRGGNSGIQKLAPYQFLRFSFLQIMRYSMTRRTRRVSILTM